MSSCCRINTSNQKQPNNIGTSGLLDIKKQVLTNLQTSITIDYCDKNKSDICNNEQFWKEKAKVTDVPVSPDVISDLEKASSNGNINIASKILNSYPQLWDISLWSSIKGGQLELVVYILTNYNYDQDTTINKGLLLSSQYGSLSIFRYLLDLELIHNNIQQCLNEASLNGNLDIVEFIIESSQTESSGVNSPLDLDSAVLAAAKSKHERVVKYLIDEGYNIIGVLLSNSVYEQAMSQFS